MLLTALEWSAFGGSMLCSILYGNGGRSGPAIGILVAILFIAFGLIAGIYAAAVSNVFFFAIHSRNLRKTHMEDVKTIQRQTRKEVKRLVDLCHGAAKKAGWWTNPETKEPLAADVPLKLCLIHSEISEALEADRKQLFDDKLPHRIGLEVELADACIRIFDLAGALNMDLGGAIAEKMEYNATRQDHKLENRAGPGGKRY